MHFGNYKAQGIIPTKATWATLKPKVKVIYLLFLCTKQPHLSGLGSRSKVNKDERMKAIRMEREVSIPLQGSLSSNQITASRL